MTTNEPAPKAVRGWRSRLRIALVAVTGLGILGGTGYGTYLWIRSTDEPAPGATSSPRSATATPTPTPATATNAELAAAAVEKALRAWGDAEAGDPTACARAAAYIHADTTATVADRCAAEVGSHPGERLVRFATSDVRLVGRTGSVHVEAGYVSDDHGPGTISTDFRVRKVDGAWKVDWTTG